MPCKEDELSFLEKLLQSSLRPQLEEYLKRRTLSGPLVVEFDPTTVCNFDCPECISIELLNNGAITLERAFELLTEFQGCGVKGIIFIGGGEPLVHSGIAGMLVHASNLGMSVGLTTNGSLIHRYKEVIAEYVNWTRISIDAATPETFAIFRPSSIKCSFFKVLSNAANLAKSKRGKMGYSFLMIERARSDGTIVTNCHEILAAAMLAREIGFDYFEFKPMVDKFHHLTPFSDKAKRLMVGQLQGLQDLNSETFRIIYPKSVDHLLKSRLLDQPKDYTRCPSIELRTVVTPNGIYPCPYKRGCQKYALGKPSTKFDDLWPSEERRLRADRINPSLDCRFYCIRHEMNVFLNTLSQSLKEGVDLLKYMVCPDVSYDFFI